MHPSRIVIGLGNPGARYRSTRHNLGFRVLDLLVARHGGGFQTEGETGGVAWTAELEISGEPVVLAKPRTYMNRSGRAAVRLCRAYEADVDRLLVVFDDADLELGRIRVRGEGSAGGHNGIRSLIEVLGSGGFERIKLGVRGAGRTDEDLADYVLQPFLPEEEETARALAELGADAVESMLAEGLVATMNRFNARRVAPPDEPTNEGAS